MIIRPRGDWEDPAMPVVGPGILLGEVTMVPAHYTAAATIPDDIPGYLRSIQRDYTVNRGYSIGYNFAVDQTGQAWECRGFDIKCAANKGANDTTIAILCLVDGAEAMNPAMVDTFTALGAEAEWRCGRDLLVVGHRDIGSTACPGDGIYHQVVAGDLDPDDGVPPVPTPPTPTPPEDDMAYGPYLIQATGRDGNPAGTVYALDRQFMTARALPDEEALAGYRWQLREAGAVAPELVDGAPIMPVDTIAAFGVII